MISLEGKPNYSAWYISEKSFDYDWSINKKLKFLLKYGILAPSTHNTQPWVLNVSTETITITPNYQLKLKEADPMNRGMYISLGCCLANIEIAAAYFNIPFRTVITENSQGASITITSKKTGKQFKHVDLFHFIPSRFSDKKEYNSDHISESDMKVLTNTCSDTTSPLLISNFTSKLSKLYYKAAGEMAQKQPFRNELSSWLRPNNTLLDDGMPGTIADVPMLISYIAPIFLRLSSKIAMVQVQKDAKKLINSPHAAVIVSKSDTYTDWILAGKTYQLVALKARSLGISTTPMAALIENPKYRKKTAKIFGTKNDPQMFFRLGYSDNRQVFTPRRPL